MEVRCVAMALSPSARWDWFSRGPRAQVVFGDGRLLALGRFRVLVRAFAGQSGDALAHLGRLAVSPLRPCEDVRAVGPPAKAVSAEECACKQNEDESLLEHAQCLPFASHAATAFRRGPGGIAPTYG